MRGKKLPALLLALLLLPCAGCRDAGEAEQGAYLLYFTAAPTGHGPALDTQPYAGEGTPDPGALLAALLAGPTQEELSSPFPRGVTLQSWAWDTEKEGNLQVRLSEQYSGLADISLTLADYCVVLTLGQLERVESVEILSQGHTASYRSHQLLLPEEALLTEAAAR